MIHNEEIIQSPEETPFSEREYTIWRRALINGAKSERNRLRTLVEHYCAPDNPYNDIYQFVIRMEKERLIGTSISEDKNAAYILFRTLFFDEFNIDDEKGCVDDALRIQAKD